MPNIFSNGSIPLPRYICCLTFLTPPIGWLMMRYGSHPLTSYRWLRNCYYTIVQDNFSTWYPRTPSLYLSCLLYADYIGLFSPSMLLIPPPHQPIFPLKYICLSTQLIDRSCGNVLLNGGLVLPDIILYGTQYRRLQGLLYGGHSHTYSLTLRAVFPKILRVMW